MFKDAVISALGAALILDQPFWIINALWEAVAVYGTAFSVLFVTIVDLEEWIKEWKYSKGGKEA